jgi:hypothetical protein
METPAAMAGQTESPFRMQRILAETLSKHSTARNMIAYTHKQLRNGGR